MEPAEAHLVFEVAEDGFHLSGTGRSQPLTIRAVQIGTGLPAIFEELETDADLAVVFGLGALASQWTVGAVVAGIDASVGDIAVVGRIARGILEV